MRAASGHDIGDSQYAQLMLETLSTLEKHNVLCNSVNIQKEVPQKITELERQKHYVKKSRNIIDSMPAEHLSFISVFAKFVLERRFWNHLLQVSKLYQLLLAESTWMRIVNRIQNCIEAARGRVYRLRAPDESCTYRTSPSGFEETDPKNA